MAFYSRKVNNPELGVSGEEDAAKYLKKSGYKILDRGYRIPAGELDIVVCKKNTLVFVEVKARKGTKFGGPLAAVTKAKQRRIVTAALSYIGQKKLKYTSVRFDVVAIVEGSPLEHIENAFIPDRFSY